MTAAPEPTRIALVAGEPSGDRLGGRLMDALAQAAGGAVAFSGVGGEAMTERGLDTLFPLSDLSVTDPLDILRQLPRIARRVRQTAAAVVATSPHALVILDSPEFNHPVAKRVRRRMPHLPIVNYVSPSVWAWRPGRARRMRAYVDHVLALLPFEPAYHVRLGGPPCTYVGHPLIERLDWIKGLDAGDLARRLGLRGDRPVLTVLPGSRANEVRRLMRPFGDAVAILQRELGPLEVVVPLVDSVRPLFEAELANWPLKPHVVHGEEAKFQAFRLARAALAASGTVTLELALAGAPTVVGYRVSPIAELPLRWLIKVPTIVLPNLVLDRKVFPDFVQRDCSPENLARALRPLLVGGPERDVQTEALRGLEHRMVLRHGTPSERAAGIVLELARNGRPGHAPMR